MTEQLTARPLPPRAMRWACFVGGLILASCDFDPCGNTVTGELIAPGKALKAVVFERGCGAMTSRAGTWVAVLPPSESLPEREIPKGVVFYNDNRGSEGGSARLDVQVAWEGDTTLVIGVWPGARILFAAAIDHGLRIRYDTLSANTRRVTP